jgi:hypothetical protein
MKTEDKNKYYNDEDEINFEKLNNFRKFNHNIKSNTSSKSHNIKYANSDKNYFNNIIKTKENLSLLKKTDAEKEVKYYNLSDFQKFDQLDNFLEYKNNTENKQNKNIDSGLSYSSNDYGEFNKIIPTRNNGKKIVSQQNKNVKIVDYGKLNDSEKKLKNKLGIEKIKIVYFD